MGHRNGDKFYLWEDSTNPTSLLGTEEWESDDLMEIRKIVSDLIHKMDGCGKYYALYIEDRYREETIDVYYNLPHKAVVI